ncbi:XRE family transcriptional regulator [Pedobacter sp. MR2016-24]|uniref:XRE family transcriptional regulator n=1 Tax=Pedobacter sp. MR2016-24 TaxID=2994466 RepID=UPI00224757E9|nr:XRE family transcriptional regulator [Pedobacter sp. MR2016-24]MCX2484512.1 XRE family transcriptional regulator [Pedobacter sp. MR2016-24]
MISGKNLKNALKRLDLSQEAAAEKIGKSRQTIVTWSSKSVLSDEIVKLINEKLNIDLSDYGDNNESNSSIDQSSIPTFNNSRKGVPYYDIDFVGGFDLVFNNTQVNPAFYIDFLPFNDADYWVNVSGKSMGPLIAHGDIVALKQVNDWKRFLLEGEIYAIITDNGFRTIKMIGSCEDKDSFMLIPYNKSEDYKPQLIPKEVITHIFRVKGAIKKFF